MARNVQIVAAGTGRRMAPCGEATRGITAFQESFSWCDIIRPTARIDGSVERIAARAAGVGRGVSECDTAAKGPGSSDSSLAP